MSVTAEPAGVYRIWSMPLPPGTTLLPANNRLHYYARNRIVTELHDVAIQLARVYQLRRLPLVDVTLKYRPPPRLRRLRHPLASDRIDDSDGLAPTLKALVDGMVRAGVISNDTRRYVRRSTCELLEGTDPRGQMILVITEIGREAA